MLDILIRQKSTVEYTDFSIIRTQMTMHLSHVFLRFKSVSSFMKTSQRQGYDYGAPSKLIFFRLGSALYWLCKPQSVFSNNSTYYMHGYFLNTRIHCVLTSSHHWIVLLYHTQCNLKLRICCRSHLCLLSTSCDSSNSTRAQRGLRTLYTLLNCLLNVPGFSHN